jgi:DNA-binding transcriptional LysR family regulator
VRWDHVQFFIAVAEGGSVGAAARALGVNHSTVLRHIAGLEATLGVRLFDRLQGGYALTDAGRTYARSLAGVGDVIDAAERGLQGADLELRGVVRLTAPDTLLHGLLLPHLAAFRALHPAIRLELVLDNDYLSLSQREADIAVRGAERPPEHLAGRPVGTVRSGLYAARSYLRTLGKAPSPANWRWVVPDASLAHLASARWIAQHVDEARIALRVNSLLALADAVRQGMGVGWLLEPLAAGHRTLVRLQDPLAAMDTPLWVLVHPSLKRVSRVATLFRFLGDRLQGDPLLAPPAPVRTRAPRKQRPG